MSILKKKKYQNQNQRKTQYTSTKVKARNLLTNVGHRRFKESDFLNLNFILDILSFLLQNFNPINIDRKVDTEDERLMISFIWEVCVPYEFAAEIYKSPNYQIIANPKLTFQKANQIVKSWIVSYNKRNELCQMIKENFKSLHYIYSTLYPKIYSKISQFGIKNKSGIELAFTRFKVQKQSLDNFKQTDIKTFFAGKNPDVYKKREKVHVNEQKPEKTDGKKWVLSEKKQNYQLFEEKQKNFQLKIIKNKKLN